MKKLFMFLMIISSVPMLFAVNDPGTSDKVSATQIRVGVVVNDVLYAGFSSEPVTHFLPPTTDITQSVKFLTSDSIFTTPNFYVYCMASTTKNVSIKIDFAPDYRKDQTGSNVGIMKSDDTSGPNIDVTLNGLGSDLSAYHTVTSGTTEGAGAVYSTGALYLSVGRNSLPDQLAGDYKTMLELELRVN